MKPQPIHPEENKYEWTDADKFVAFGEKNKQVVTGHCLIWHSQIGRWFFVDDSGKDVTPEVLKERMRQHIMTVVGRYKGRVKGGTLSTKLLKTMAHTVIASSTKYWARISSNMLSSLLMKPTQMQNCTTTIIM
jgi:hypothetical protein